jgi:hypothetical protein
MKRLIFLFVLGAALFVADAQLYSGKYIRQLNREVQDFSYSLQYQLDHLLPFGRH